MILFVIAAWFVDQVISFILGKKITIVTMIFDFIIALILVWIIGSIIQFYTR